MYLRLRLIGGISAHRYAKRITTSLTGRDIEHIPMVPFWGKLRTLFVGDERLEHSNGRTMNVASNECDPNALVLRQGLQITDEIISFPLRVPGSVPPLTRNKVKIPCDLLTSSDRS